MVIYAAKIVDINTVCSEKAEKILDKLDKDRKNKLLSIKHKDERTRSVFAGLLLRYAFLMAGHSEAQWKKAEISYGKYGKPYIEGSTDFFYSLSHSGEWVICAADNAPVGADIQEERRWSINTAKRFYSLAEYERLIKYGDGDSEAQKTLFYRLWAAKESCVKLTGRGIGAGISGYVADEDFKHIYENENNCFNIKIYDTIENYIVCACSKGENFPAEITEAGLERLW